MDTLKICTGARKTARITACGPNKVPVTERRAVGERHFMDRGVDTDNAVPLDKNEIFFRPITGRAKLYPLERLLPRQIFL